MKPLNRNSKSQQGQRSYKALLLPALFLGVSSSAWAIPSPDMVISLSASVAQVFGLLSALFAGMAFKGKSGQLILEKRSRRSRLWRWGFRISLLALLGSVLVNVFQYTSNIDEKNSRLHTNLIRSSKEAGKAVGDTSLKTLPFSAQINHPLGITNRELAAWIEEGRALNLIDVREDEEFEMGSIKGSLHRRYPDLRNNSNGLIQKGKETVLLCYSGNRSSELCEQFVAEGKPCRFMIGGYEKWIAESLPMELAKANTNKDLRSIPSYANSKRLLDTPEVVKMVEEEKAYFVDLRYPQDFKAGHLPSAINIPLRKMPSSEVASVINSLPKQPVIAACYDKRSCFYAKILGLRLSRAGFDYRGRYTVPHEFFMPNVTAQTHWKRSQQSNSLLSMVANPLRSILDSLTGNTGNFAVSILLLVIILRLTTLPFTWKSERDRIVQRNLVPEINELRARISDDPQRLSRATVHLYRRERLTPFRNFMGTMAQLILFLVFFSVVNSSADDWDSTFLWFASASAIDQSYILPTAVSLLFFGFILYTASKHSWRFMLLYCAGGVLIWALTYNMNVAVNLYLLFNISMLFMQSKVIQLFYKKRSANPLIEAEHAKATPQEDPGIVDLAQAHLFPGSGQKAIRLGQLISAGLPVPSGFVVTSKILNRSENECEDTPLGMTAKEMRLMKRLWRRVGADKVAVRSSGLNEDGENQSYAGVFDSLLNITKDKLTESLDQIRQSMNTVRTESYAGNNKEVGGALIQKMVDAEYAGVLFTEHPGSTGCQLVEMVSGLGEALVSGKVTPKSYRFGTISGDLLDKKNPPIDLAPLLALGRTVEELFGSPQDIEWAYANGKFMLLQARDITASVCNKAGKIGAIERERRRLLRLAPNVQSSNEFLAQNELSELLPRPTPLSASLMERMWAPGGSTDLACRLLGMPYDVEEDSPEFVTVAFGALYINKHEEARRVKRTAGMAAAFSLARGAEGIEAEFREGFLPAFLKEMRLRESMDFNQLKRDELLALSQEWSDQFITETYLRAEVINVATDFYWKTARAKLEAKGIDPAPYLGNVPQTIMHHAMSLLSSSENSSDSYAKFLEMFGHRAPQDYELSQPRYSESHKLLLKQIKRARKAPDTATFKESLPSDPMLRMVVDRANRFQVLKEDAKHHCLRQLALIRKLFLALDERFGLNGGIFQLTLDEVMNLNTMGNQEHVKELISQRQADAQIWEKVRLPSSLSIKYLERKNFLRSDKMDEVLHTGDLQGTKVAGQGEVIGKVFIIDDPRDIDNFSRDEILVARLTDPTWYPAFPKAAGVVTEVGGWLSHAAIVARELNLTAIVGVKGATQALETGQLVKLCSNGTIELLDDKRRSGSPMRHKRKSDLRIITTNEEEALLEQQRLAQRSVI